MRVSPEAFCRPSSSRFSTLSPSCERTFFTRFAISSRSSSRIAATAGFAATLDVLALALDPILELRLELVEAEGDLVAKLAAGRGGGRPEAFVSFDSALAIPASSSVRQLPAAMCGTGGELLDRAVDERREAFAKLGPGGLDLAAECARRLRKAVVDALLDPALSLRNSPVEALAQEAVGLVQTLREPP